MPDYTVLRARVEAQGLYRRAYAYYAWLLAFICIGIGASLYLITLNPSPYLQIPNAAFLAFMIVQGGLLGHDCSHQQVFASERLNRIVAMLMWGLFGGLSEGGWYEKHNAHHQFVNWVSHDPDLSIPFIFSQKQRASMHPAIVWYLPYEHWLFFAALPLIYLNAVRWSWSYILRAPLWRALVDSVLIIVHFAILFLIIFSYLPILLGCVFLGIMVAVSGLYMSLIFAPNHKGEAIIGAEETPSWTTQITSTRNFQPTAVSFFLTGGLTFQIEHHLFTSMARPRYWQAQPIVRAFCAEHAIPYHETTWPESMRQIYRALREQARTRAV